MNVNGTYLVAAVKRVETSLTKTHNGVAYEVVSNNENTDKAYWCNCQRHSTEQSVIAWIEEVFGTDFIAA